ncbi:phage minor head protein [Acinetobacter sp. ANC 3832]|uniref:phage head morphogenesis protein n=1 Tax=Acinetobacter sp. ANC 3832 TaxID=1977874 RepID=UPI000A33B003|nr:phage minor head protein [Acinetobacter sp. ANC 3832]OTG87220.1 phage head morphogenesis protein [Acinetobacter sp. ANC 3832]
MTVSYTDALRYAREKKVVLPEEFYLLDLNARQYATTVSKLASLDQIRTVINLSNKAIEDGSTFQDFKKAIEENGIELSPHHLENIFRTNIQNAYAHGIWTQQQENKTNRPYLRYSSLTDSRVRPSHLVLNNIIRHIDDSFWYTYYPPNGYLCRCGVSALTEAQAKRLGITPDDKLPVVQPDKGFSTTPASYGKHLNDVLQEKIDDAILTDANLASELAKIKDEAIVSQQANDEIVKAFEPMSEKTKEDTESIVDRVLEKNKDVEPSAIRMLAELIHDDEHSLTDLLKSSVVRNDEQSNSITNWMRRSFQSLLSIAKNLKNKITGNNLKGFDSLELKQGNVIGIQTPTLFKTAEKVGKNIIITDAKGIALDLTKFNGLDGALLAPDLNLEVVSVSDSEIVLRKTKEVATRLFIANNTLHSTN